MICSSFVLTFLFSFRFLSSTVRLTCVRATFSLLALLVAIAGPALLLAFQVLLLIPIKRWCETCVIWHVRHDEKHDVRQWCTLFTDTWCQIFFFFKINDEQHDMRRWCTLFTDTYIGAGRRLSNHWTLVWGRGINRNHYDHHHLWCHLKTTQSILNNRSKPFIFR